MTSISIVTNGLNGVITCSCSDCNATDDNDFKILCENLKRGREELKRDHEERKRDLQASFDRQDALLAQSYESLIKMMKQRQPTAIAKVSVPPRLPSLNPSTSRKTTKAASKIVMNEHKPEDDEEETQQDVQKPAPKAVQQKRRAKTSPVDKKTIEDLANIYISSQKKKETREKKTKNAR